MHDGTPTCSPYNDDIMEGLLTCDFFFLKNMSMKMRTSITWIMIQVMKTPLCPTYMFKRSPRHSWKIQSMRKIMKHKLWMVLLILLSMAYLKERTWTLWPWKNLIQKRSMQYIHMIYLSHISLSVMKTKRT